jgi:tRNA(adenine34) deaminase
MRRALDLADEAEAAGEVPVGCVVVAGAEPRIIGEGRNSPIELLDPTAHAEMLALRQAALAAGNYRLEDATVYCTLEPCPMCAGAMVAARVGTLVFGARDLRFGGVRSKFQIADSPLLNHRIEIVEGVLGAEATAMLQRFFSARRVRAESSQ